MDYEIILSNKTPQSLLVSISQYWSALRGQENTNELNFDKVIIEKILKYSYCVVSISCRLCSTQFIKKLKSKEELDIKIYKSEKICDNCINFSPNYTDELSPPICIASTLKNLTSLEFKILEGIMRLKKKHLIYRHIFNNKINDPEIWDTINQLQNKGLIWIDRDSSWKIRNFYFQEELFNHIPNCEN